VPEYYREIARQLAALGVEVGDPAPPSVRSL
jgi:hypothetical protein